MPDLKDIAKDPRAQFAAIAMIAGALGATTINALTDDPAREDSLATLGEALKAGSAETKPATPKLDTNAVHAEIKKLCGDDPHCVDIGAGLVQPGAVYAAGVNVARGLHLVAVADCPGRSEMEGLVCVLDPGTWAITAVGCVDRPEDDEHTWCEVTARNTGDKAQRFLALVRTSP